MSEIDDEVKSREDFESSEDEDVKAVMPPSDVVSFNEMRSCADLFRMYKKGILEIRPDFQRGIVWKTNEMSLFVDSLIKQLPIPSLCVSLDSSTGKRMVIDGLQRIWTIIRFLDSEKDDWRISNTEGVDARIAGKTVSTVKKEQIRLCQILEDVTLPINTIRCDYSDNTHMEYLFQIFSRLNSGGRRLLGQEIRNCVFQGSLNTFLKAYVHTEKWLSFVDHKSEEVDKYRFGNEERVLRFMAFYDRWESYSSSLVRFLNSYMRDNRDICTEDIVKWQRLLNDSLDVVSRIQAKKETRKNWNVMECVLVGISKNINAMRNASAESVTERFNELIASPEYTERMKEGVLHGTKVRDRIDMAIRYFA